MIFQINIQLVATTFQASLRLLPPPFDSIVEVIYDKFEGSDQEKLKEARKFLKELRTQGEDHYNMIASQMAKNITELTNIVAKETTLLEIKDIMISKDGNINRKLDAIMKSSNIC